MSISTASVRQRVIFCFILLCVGCFYHWTIHPEGRPEPFDPAGNDLYNLMVKGWLRGQLSLDVQVNPELAHLKNPYDPIERAGRGIHDASYYQGRYYLYFGAPPALLLQLPVRLLTGTWIRESYAVLFFSLAGWAAAARLWWELGRRGQGSSRIVFWIGLLVIGVGNLLPAMIRRPGMWEIPIGAGYALFMLTLLAGWRATRPGAGLGWLVLASASMGLTVATRPVYLFASVFLLVPLLMSSREAGSTLSFARRRWGRFAAAFAPIAILGLATACYNFLRFDDPLQFGQRYQFAYSEDITHQLLFSPKFFAFNLRVYLLLPPSFSPFFPFLTIARVPPAPVDQIGTEDPQGLLAMSPWVLTGLLVWWVWRRDSRRFWWCTGAVLGTAGTFGVLCGFAGTTNRYLVDFAPTAVLLGGLGLLGLAAHESKTLRWLAPILAVPLGLWTIAANTMDSLQHNRLLETQHPESYRQLARIFNHIPYWIDRTREQTFGPLELRLRFPESPKNDIEALVVTGTQNRSDYVYVRYLPDHFVSFGFHHTGLGGGQGRPIKYEPGAEQVVTVQMGSLYPPREHPGWANITPDEINYRRRTVDVRMNGQKALLLRSATFDPTSRHPSIGTSQPDHPEFPHGFSGTIARVKTIPPLSEKPLFAGDDPNRIRPGALHMVLEPATFVTPISDPLLCSGKTGEGDLIYLYRLSSDTVRIGHDHWGAGAIESDTITIDPSLPLEFVIDCPPLRGEGAEPRLTITLNGRVVLDRRREFHSTPIEAITPLQNTIGASTSFPQFRGSVITLDRIP